MRFLPLQWGVLLLLARPGALYGWDFNVTLASLTNHNTSAFAAYNQQNFPANFGTTTWVSQSGSTLPVDPTKMDESLNPVTPGHVSRTDVHTLIPARPDLRWFAHATPWFGTSSHINIGLTNDSTGYVAAMINDMKQRGFNGVIIDWYGRDSVEDAVSLKIQAYLAGLGTHDFTYLIMMDKGVHGGTSTTNLTAQIEYCQNQYFNDPNYEHEPLTNGLPILMFFGVRAAIGASAMTTLKAATGGQMVWVEQGTAYLSESWEDECFEWTSSFNNGVNTNDPFNLIAVTNSFPAIRSSGKKAFGAMCSQFDGTLTKSVSWSMGKYLPASNGLCEVERARVINAAIPANMTRMQWATWSDWEEGTEVEAGIENEIAPTGQIDSSNVLSWSVSGDERTIDHYEIYASSNGVTAAWLTSVPVTVHQVDLDPMLLPSGNYQVYIDAVGKPCIRDHLSPAVSYVSSAAPVIVADLQPLAQKAWQGDAVSFNVVAGGEPPLSYQWLVDDHAIGGATNSAYTFAAAVGTNAYQVVVSNNYGSVTSSIAAVTGVPAIFLDPADYSRVQITFSGYTNGEKLVDFPALVRFSTNMVGFSYAQFASPADGADLRFVAANGRELPYEIDTWDPSGESLVWVQVPSLTSSNDYIIACWGNPADRSIQPWTTNGDAWTEEDGPVYALVYHLGQAGFPFIDSTLKYPAASGVVPLPTHGVVGAGNIFDGSSQFLDAGRVGLDRTFTVSAWVNIASNANSEQTIWDNKSGGWNVAGFDFYVNGYHTNDGVIYFDTADGVGGNVAPRTGAHAVSFGQWHLLTGVIDSTNGTVRVYVDGIDETIDPGVDLAFQVTNDVRCGSLLTGTPGAGGNLFFDGSMDETRIENSARSAAWIHASWATVADGAFARDGAVEKGPAFLYCQPSRGKLVLTWTIGTLQSAPAVTGPYSDVTGGSSPYTLTPALSQQFFRLRNP